MGRGVGVGNGVGVGWGVGVVVGNGTGVWVGVGDGTLVAVGANAVGDGTTTPMFSTSPPHPTAVVTSINSDIAKNLLSIAVLPVCARSGCCAAIETAPVYQIWVEFELGN